MHLRGRRLPHSNNSLPKKVGAKGKRNRERKLRKIEARVTISLVSIPCIDTGTGRKISAGLGT